MNDSNSPVDELLECSKALSVMERISLAQAIWETISDLDALCPDEEVLKELNQRNEASISNPSVIVSETDMAARIAGLRSRFQ